MYALVDGNNFFVSCERVFNPALWGIPLVVLSNNDGCIIARSPEAKALGIKMGAPFHEWRDKLAAHGGQWRSANFVLYGDLSARMGMILRQHCGRVESYSIDESFCDLTPWRASEFTAIGQAIRHDLYQQLGLPVCVGIGPTKTLAKLANHIAKKNPEFKGVCRLDDAEVRRHWLAKIAVEEVWGVGSRLQKKLNECGIMTVADLAAANGAAIRQLGAVVLQRTQNELNGVASFSIQETIAKHQQIIASRSFGRPIKKLQDLREAVSSFAARAGEKLRAESQLCSLMEVTLATNRFAKDGITWRKSILVTSPFPTSDSRNLAKMAIKGVDQLYRPDFAFHKAGIMLMNLQPVAAWQAQGDLFATAPSADEHIKSDKLMAAMDTLNRRYGRRLIHSASEGVKPAWLTRRNFISPAYTSQWQELMEVSLD